MQAASSPMTCTCGFRMVVWMGLLFLASTAGQWDSGYCFGPQAPLLPSTPQPGLPHSRFSK